PLTPPNQVVPEISEGGSESIARAMAKHPSDRYQSYDEFIMAMQAARSLLLRQLYSEGHGGAGNAKGWWKLKSQPRGPRLLVARLLLFVLAGSLLRLGLDLLADRNGHELALLGNAVTACNLLADDEVVEDPRLVVLGNLCFRRDIEGALGLLVQRD